MPHYRHLVANGNRRHNDSANSICYPTKPTFATLPFIGIQPALMDAEGKEVHGNNVQGRLCGIPGQLWPEPFGGTTTLF